MNAERRGSLMVDAALLAVVLMWAATFTLFKIAWHDVDPVAFTGLFLWAAGKERATRREVAGVAIGFIGVAVFLRAWDAFGAATVGDLLSLLAAAAFGAYGVINRPLVERYPARQLMAYSL